MCLYIMDKKCNIEMLFISFVPIVGKGLLAYM